MAYDKGMKMKRVEMKKMMGKYHPGEYGKSSRKRKMK